MKRVLEFAGEVRKRRQSEREKRSLVFVFVLRVSGREHLNPKLTWKKGGGFCLFSCQVFAQWVGSNMPEPPNGLFF